MIKASELRIGNIFHAVTALGYPRAICKVLTITQDYAEVEYQLVGYGAAPNNPGIAPVLYKDAQPIPLTDEWLERLGFDKRINRIDEHGLLKILENGKYEIIEFTDAETYRSYDNKIEYVHQLQNLFFALSDGIELKIKELA